MNQIKNYIFFPTGLFMLMVILFLSSCNKNYYVAPDFDQRTQTHKTIAVLPFDIIFTGNWPEKFTEQDIEAVKTAEAKAFQISFYNQLLGSTRAGKKNIRVEVQGTQKTLSMLESKGVSPMEVKDKDPEALAQMLGVDAVVSGTIRKNRIMSDLASYGIEIGVDILQEIGGGFFGPYIPGRATVSKEIAASFVLLDRKGSSTLWSIAFEVDADWRLPANEIIDNLNRRAAKKFPYRID